LMGNGLLAIVQWAYEVIWAKTAVTSFRAESA
jgi:hypothetical protein